VYSLSVGELTLRLVVAAVAGVALGLERELRGHPAGARTHALVAVGAALFTISGAYGFPDVPRGPTIDPARVAAQVASGIGFLGAGAILRQGLGVRGLTTAATLWLASAIGVASGAGSYPAVAIGTIVVLVVLVVLRLLKPLLLRWGAPTTVIELEYERGHGTLGPVIQTLNQLSTKLEQIDVDDETQNGLRHVTVHVAIRDVEEMQRAVDRLRARPEVRRVHVAASAPPELLRPMPFRAATRPCGAHRRGRRRSPAARR
jgi:putative Mg2+ transporter-C (MgtC) family protein